MNVLRSFQEAARCAVEDLRHQTSGLGYEHDVPVKASTVAVLLMTPEVQLTLGMRTYQALDTAGYPRAAHVLYSVFKRRYGCDISPKANIGPGLRMTHCSDVVIGPNVRLGRDVVIFNGVTLGNRLGSCGEGMPLVGDGVLLGTGAKILGPIEIGDAARVGANAVVLDSVPAGAVAVGVPARILNPAVAEVTTG